MRVTGPERRVELDYLVATNDLDLAADLVTSADAANLEIILLNNDFDPRIGEPRRVNVIRG